MVEYVSCIWSSYHVGKTKQIESVQRNITKRLPGYAILNYEARLSSLGLQSFEMIKLKNDLSYAYKIVFGVVSDAAMNMFTLTLSTQHVIEATPTNYIRTITASTCEYTFF